MLIKQAHQASKDIANIYSDEGVPKIISYPFWFILLVFGGCLKKLKGVIND